VNTLNNAHSATRTFCSHFSLKGCCTVCPSSKQVTQWVFVEVYHQIGNTQCESILKGYDTNYGTDFGLLLLFLFFVCLFVRLFVFVYFAVSHSNRLWKPYPPTATVPCSKKLEKQNVTFQIKKKITFPAGL